MLDPCSSKELKVVFDVLKKIPKWAGDLVIFARFSKNIFYHNGRVDLIKNLKFLNSAGEKYELSNVR